MSLEFPVIVELVKISYGSLFAILFLFGTDLLIRHYRADKYARKDAAHTLFFIIGIGVLGDAFYTLIAINNYIYDPIDWLTAIQNLVAMVNILILALAAENIIFPNKKHIKFGSIGQSKLSLGAIIIIIYLIVLIAKDALDLDNAWDIDYYYIVYCAMILYGLVAFMGMVTIFFYRLRPQKDIRDKIRTSLLFGIFALIGALIRSIGRWNHNILFFIGMCMEILGWLFIRWKFLSIPSYSELEWRSGIIEGHVIYAESGIMLYSQIIGTQKPCNDQSQDKPPVVSVTLESNSIRPETDLIGGGMIGIKSMLQEITGAKGKLQHIQIGERHLCFYQGQHVLVVILTENNLGVYYTLLQQAVDKIEKLNPQLKDFNGDLNSLQIAPVMKSIFQEVETRNFFRSHQKFLHKKTI